MFSEIVGLESHVGTGAPCAGTGTSPCWGWCLYKKRKRHHFSSMRTQQRDSIWKLHWFLKIMAAFWDLERGLSMGLETKPIHTLIWGFSASKARRNKCCLSHRTHVIFIATQDAQYMNIWVIIVVLIMLQFIYSTMQCVKQYTLLGAQCWQFNIDWVNSTAQDLTPLF